MNRYLHEGREKKKTLGLDIYTYLAAVTGLSSALGLTAQGFLASTLRVLLRVFVGAFAAALSGSFWSIDGAPFQLLGLLVLFLDLTLTIIACRESRRVVRGKRLGRLPLIQQALEVSEVIAGKLLWVHPARHIEVCYGLVQDRS